MSEIRANTVSNAAGTGPVTLTGQYAAKAWMRFSTVGTQTILGSFNCSSITDTGTGDSNITVTSAFADANASVPSTTHYTNVSWMVTPKSQFISTTTIDFRTATLTPASGDADGNSFAAYGDLA